MRAGKTELALGVADYRYREGGAVASGGDDDTLHLPLCVGGDGSRERRRPLRTGIGWGRKEQQRQYCRDRAG